MAARVAALPPILFTTTQQLFMGASAASSNIQINGIPVTARAWTFKLAYDTDHEFNLDILLDPDQQIDLGNYLGKHLQFQASDFQYSGLIKDIQMEARKNGASLQITGKSPTWKLSSLQVNRSFCKMSPKAIANALLADFGDIPVENNLPDGFTLNYWVAFRESYGNALRRLCEDKCGDYFFYDGNTLHLGLGANKNPKTADERLILGLSLHQVWLNAGIAPVDIQANGWNPYTQESITGKSQSGTTNSVLQEVVRAARAVFAKPEQWLFAKPSSSSSAAIRKASGVSAARLNRLFSIGGRSDNPKLYPGTIIEVDTDDHGACFGNALNGLFRILSVEYSGGAQDGLQNIFYAVPATVNRPPSSATRYRPSCLSMVGIVRKVKDNLVQVVLPWDDPKADLPFQRVIQAQAHPEFQTHYLPTPDTQVLCLFEDGSPSKPIVLGAFYTGKETDAGRWNGKHGFQIGDVKFLVDEKTGTLEIGAKHLIFNAPRYDFE